MQCETAALHEVVSEKTGSGLEQNLPQVYSHVGVEVAGIHEAVEEVVRVVRVDDLLVVEGVDVEV